MKLILLYGPPAVGKLTISKLLSTMTGISVFHNHMMLNPLREIFGLDNPIRAKLEYEFRLRIIEEAIASEKNLIMTGVITMRNYKEFYKMVIEKVQKGSGEIFLVKLTAPEKILKERVIGKDREKTNKIHTVESWESFAKEYPEMHEKFLDTRHLEIDTAILTPKKAAEKIILYAHLT